MTNTFVSAFAGGVCIGTASILIMLSLGKIAGISGISYTAITKPVEEFWSLFFITGLVLGASLFHFFSGYPVPMFDAPMPLILAAGFIVGVGTKMGSGCTSGHGICGIGRLSIRSIIATATFMLFGFVTVYIRLHGSAS